MVSFEWKNAKEDTMQYIYKMKLVFSEWVFTVTSV